MTQPVFLQDPILSVYGDAIAHGFFTRLGGVSKGDYTALNCAHGVSDDPALVDENRARALSALHAGAKRLVTVSQVHGIDVAVIRKEADIDPARKADAIVTNIPGLAIGILTADCVPILFYDPLKNIIAAAHAGWRGAIGGVLKTTMDAMQSLGANREDIIAVAGPCIGQDSYEVGAEFQKEFLSHDDGNGIFFKSGARGGHFQFDLQAYVLARLMKMQLGRIAHIAEDTAAKPDVFFSHRRATLTGNPVTGRQLSAIVLK